MEKKKREIEQLSNQEVAIEGPTYELQHKLALLKDSFNESQNKIDEELYTESTYKHML